MTKRVLKIIGSFSLALVVAIGSFFVPNLRTSEAESASASYVPPVIQVPDVVLPPPQGDNDTSYNYQSVFKGSDIVFSNVAYVKLSSIASGSTVQDFNLYNTVVNSNAFYDGSINYMNFQFTLALTDNTFGIGYRAFRSTGAFLYNPTFNDGSSYGFNSIPFNYGFNDIQSSFIPNSQYLYTTYSSMQTLNFYGNRIYGYNFGLAIYRNNSTQDTFVSPSFDMRFLIIGNYLDVPDILGINLPYVNCNYVIYVDTAGYYYILALPNGTTLASATDDSPYFYHYRRYILKDADYSNNEIYQQGLQDGYSSGYDVGETNGYRDGYSSGLSIGKNLGYNQGLQANSRLTFSGLMTSVVDVPVKVFVNLFDFDILGVNILVFLSTLLTISLVLFLIKKIKGA